MGKSAQDNKFGVTLFIEILLKDWQHLKTLKGAGGVGGMGPLRLLPSPAVRMRVLRQQSRQASPASGKAKGFQLTMHSCALQENSVGESQCQGPA